MDIFRIEKPNFKTIDRQNVITKYADYIAKGGRNLVKELSEPNYLYWDKAKYYSAPEGFTSLEVWYVVRQARKFFPNLTPILTEDGQAFTYSKLTGFEEMLHRIDMEAGGQMIGDYKTISESNKEKFLKRGIIEESIASSQLEGADTARKAAKKMIMQNKKPSNPSENMIMNNYNAMMAIEEDFQHKKMDLDLLFSLHQILTEKDHDVPESERGRLRKDSDLIVVQKRGTNTIVHIPPGEEFLKSQIDNLIAFANDELKTEFIHPVIKATLLHFWIGYLHPFTEGNGRMARTIFYWYLLRKNYWAMMYLPISTVIKKSPAQYIRAYVYSEQDDRDVTYFIEYQLKKIILALNEFHIYIQRKLEENKTIEEKFGNKVTGLNDRQKHSLNYLLEENAYTTAEMHLSIFGVTRLTAYKDLKKMEELQLIKSTKVGREKRYTLKND